MELEYEINGEIVDYDVDPTDVYDVLRNSLLNEVRDPVKKKMLQAFFEQLDEAIEDLHWDWEAFIKEVLKSDPDIMQYALDWFEGEVSYAYGRFDDKRSERPDPYDHIGAEG